MFVSLREPATRSQFAAPLCAAALCLALLPAACGALRAGEASEALLDECVAGINASLALIEHGTARYRLVTWDQGPGGWQSYRWDLKVVFDLPRRHFELCRDTELDGVPVVATHHSIIDGNERVEYFPPLGGLRLPSANIVVVRSNYVEHTLMDPRQQQHNAWADPPSFAWRIATMRRHPTTQPAARRRADGLVEISFQPPLAECRGIYLLSPEQGYGVVGAKEWSATWAGPEPSDTCEAEYQQANNGAFVVSHRHERDFTPVDGRLVPARDEELWLEEIDLVSRPAPQSFTLDSLDLPIGATVHDRLHGHEYRFGIDAVTEADIDVGGPSGPMGLRRWLNLVNAIIGAAALFWLGNRLGRWCDRGSRRVVQ